MVLLLAATPMPSHASLAADRAAITRAITQLYGSPVHITGRFISGDFAIARLAELPSVRYGLKRLGDHWTIACRLDTSPTTAQVLRNRCGFGAKPAEQLAADEQTNVAAANGNFSTAARTEQTALRAAAPGTTASEAARLQLLNSLNNQMNLGMISRANAIQQWNQLRFSFFVP